MPNTAAWVDTGFLVALFARDDEHFASAVEFLANAQRLELHCGTDNDPLAQYGGSNRRKPCASTISRNARLRAGIAGQQ